MAKSPDAFRTISEVADWLGIQAHVLRFWESKFTQVKPIKRAGGRRYYRPADMLLLGGIKKLLHDDGLTIKGVQKILREEGMSHVADMSAPLDELTLSQLGDAAPAKPAEKPATAVTMPEEEKGVVLNFESAAASKSDEDSAQAADPKEEMPEVDETVVQQAAPETIAPEPEPEKQTQAPVEDKAEQKQPEHDAVTEPTPEPSAAEPEIVSPPDTEPEKIDEAAAAPESVTDPEPAVGKPDAPAPAEGKEDPAPVAALPAFLRRPLADQDSTAEKPKVEAEAQTEAAPEPAKAEPTPPAPAAKKPRVIDLPAFTAEADFPAAPAALTAAFRARKIAPENAGKAKAALQKLTILRDSMAARRRGATPPPAKD